jgi:23S rRNA (adenine2503-C2)-methyltransferase
VNLIPFNHHPGLEYDKPFEETIRAFQKYISDRSYAAPVRYSKGLDISGACGQLAAKKIESLEALPQRKSALFTSVTS